jgi:hypothetical protein
MNAHRHDLLITRPLYGARVRLRNVPTGDAVYFVLNGIAAFENRRLQKEASELLATAFGGESKVKP